MEEIKISSDLKTRIIDKVILVLLKNHSISEKRNVLSTRDRLNFACPYCGDSHESNRKKRGNIYWRDLYFHCYNCSVHVSLDHFLNDFKEALDSEDRINVINYSNNNKRVYSSGETLNFYLFDKISEYALTFEELACFFNISRINENTYRAYPYLRSRLLHNKLEYFGYDNTRKELYVFNLNNEKKIIGFQIRSLDGKGPKYKTWNIRRIYDRINKSLGEDLTEEELENLDKISMLFGILQVDLGRTFTVFEGPLDAMFMKNSLGLTGVKKQIVEFNSVPTVRYFFDNDIEGKTKMIEKLKSDQSVFMWDKFTKEFNIPNKQVKDLNDLVKYELKHRIGCLQDIDKYFTNNHLDMVYV